MDNHEAEKHIQLIQLPTPDRGFGQELNEVLRFTSLYTPSILLIDDLDFSGTQFDGIVLSDKEKEVLQLCTNEFSKMPTSKYATEIAKRMYEGDVLRGDLIPLFISFIVPKVRELIGWKDRLKSDNQ